jgi:hypothetical protein
MSGKYQDTGMCDMMYNHLNEYSTNPGAQIRDECRRFAGKCNSGFDKNLNYCLSKKAAKDGENFCSNYFKTKGNYYPLVNIRDIPIDEDTQYQDLVEDDKANGCSTEYEDWGQWKPSKELRFRRLDKNKYKKIGKKSTPRRSSRKPPSKSKRRLTRKSPSRSKRLSNGKSPTLKSPTKKSPRKSSRSTRKR